MMGVVQYQCPRFATPRRIDYQDESRATSHLVAFRFAIWFLVMVSRDTETEAEEEQIHFQNVITTIQQYASHTVCPCALATHPVVLNF